jgi:hypothetical protein
MTCKEIFHLYEKISKRSSDRGNRELDENDESEIENLMKINHSDHHSKNRFRIFSYRWKNFLACHQIHTKMTLNDDRTRVIYREREARKLYFDQVLDFSIHHFHQVLDFFDQRIVFGIFHTDEKVSLHVIRCMRKRHLSVIVDIIKSDVMIQMNQREKATSF